MELRWLPTGRSAGRAWRRRPRRPRRIAIVLSDYPGVGGGQVGHAVGLDTFASLEAIVEDLRACGLRLR